MIYPCIDLQDGEVVQLIRGQQKGIEIAKSYIEMAELFGQNKVAINVINLNAAKGTGDTLWGYASRKAVEEILKIADARVGGGVRTAEEAKRLIDLGAKKVIFGSAAFDETGLDYGFLETTVRAVGRDKLIAALDVKDGKIAVKGWQESIDIDPLILVGGLEEFCSEIQCTYVDKEGMMQGTNPYLFNAIRKKTSLELTAAGGITTLQDVEDLERIGANSVIGMAFYTGKIPLEEVIRYNQLDFVKTRGFIPTIVQNIAGDVLYLQSTDRESLRKMLETGTVWRFSKTKNKLLQVGSESRKIEYVKGIFTNCYRDTLLLRVEQTKGYACHEGYPTCFFRERKSNGLFEVCQTRVVDPKEIYKR
jgi:phosphoribosylformimino-5-aminoimidazole carboxamide ribonucleotide (ProFAR) isomerase/phosphoribosyl-AMP cyclohydrolase